jgi:hypothetical protein
MGAGDGIVFFVDEHFPERQMRSILAPHVMTAVQIRALDQEILRTAELQSAIVITADKWFLKELYRYPPGHRHCFARAGVIQLPGEWDRARQRLADYLPVIEAVFRLRRSATIDQRIGIDLSQAQIRIHEP